jgi:hypothetical protein
MMLNTVASTADQNPTAFVDGEMCVTIAYLFPVTRNVIELLQAIPKKLFAPISLSA